jgi:hypothetical protein
VGGVGGGGGVGGVRQRSSSLGGLLGLCRAEFI